MRFPIQLVSFAALLAACNGTAIDEPTETDVDTDGTETGDSGDSGDTEDTDVTTECQANVSAIAPEDGQAAIPVDSDVVVYFSDPVGEGEWSISVSGPDGDVSGTSVASNDGLSATFTPDEPFENYVVYEVLATACEDSGVAAFKTVSAPITAGDLVSRTYVLDFDEVEWRAPQAISLFESQLTIDYLFLEITDATDESLSVSGSVGSEGVDGPEQSCYPVLEFADVDFSDNPTFTAETDELIIPAGDTFEVRVEDLDFQGSFNQDADKIEAVSVTGLLDLRSVESQLPPEAGDACDLVALLGDDCVPCEDQEEKCIQVWITAEEADYDESLHIDEEFYPDCGGM